MFDASPRVFRDVLCLSPSSASRCRLTASSRRRRGASGGFRSCATVTAPGCCRSSMAKRSGWACSAAAGRRRCWSPRARRWRTAASWMCPQDVPSARMEECSAAGTCRLRRPFTDCSAGTVPCGRSLENRARALPQSGCSGSARIASAVRELESRTNVVLPLHADASTPRNLARPPGPAPSDLTEWNAASRRCVDVRFVDGRTFTALTGLAGPAPLDRTPGLRDRLLP